jgi:serine/threonine-protein kinase
MSRVFVAEELRLKRKVVVKVLSPELAQGISVERFEREIQTVAALQHANIVPVHTAGDTNGLPFYTMPFVDGESLRARLGRGPLAVTDVIGILRDVSKALAYAHQRGVVHRDIKPDNVLISGGVAVVTDFGIAKAISASRTSLGGATLTQIGTSIGTPAYMAPEQAAGDPQIDARADIYSLGAMAYELLSGQVVFADRTAQRMLAAHMSEAPRPIAELRADVPAPLADLVMRCLEKNPADRPQGAQELVRALDTIGSTSGAAAPARATTKRPVGGRRRTAYGALALLLVTAAIVLYARRGGSGTGASEAGGALSLAVLPIENVGGDSSKQYLADGMTTELAGALRKTPGLQVAGDLSTFRFRKATASVSDMARQLGVRMLLTGKLQSQGGRIRLQMQLANAGGKLLWSNTFDRENKDNFALQDDVTAAVVSDLRLALSPATIAASRAGRTVNPEAHDLYMRGMFEKNQLSEQGLRRALRYFADALKLDPNYAQAHEGMAFTYDMLADAYAPSHEYHLLARAAAERALQSDSMLASARVIRGFEMGAANWEFEQGLAEMRRGLAQNTNDPDALFMFSAFLSISGHVPEGIEVAERLAQIDPLSPMGSLAHATALFFAGRWAETLRQDSVTKRLDPTITYFDAFDGTALRELGHLPESFAAYRAWEALSSTPSFGIAATYWKMGRPDEAKRALAALEQRARRQWVDPTWIAIAYAGSGDRENAMRWLGDAFRQKAFSLRFLMNVDWQPFAVLQGDSRFVELRKRVLATTFVD